jgi:hypothetical protein
VDKAQQRWDEAVKLQNQYENKTPELIAKEFESWYKD